MNRATCSYFVLCDHPAEGVIANPVIGDVPTCKRCADTVGLELVTDPERCLTVGVVPPELDTDDAPIGVEWAAELGRFLVRYSWASRAVTQAVHDCAGENVSGYVDLEIVGFQIVGFDGTGGELEALNTGDAIAVVAIRNRAGDVARFFLAPQGATLFDITEAPR